MHEYDNGKEKRFNVSEFNNFFTIVFFYLIWLILELGGGLRISENNIYPRFQENQYKSAQIPSIAESSNNKVTLYR